jgi:hypothetical protein
LFSQYHDLLRLQVNDIKASFNQNRAKTRTKLGSVDVFKRLKYVVSDKAMEFLIEEYRKGERGLLMDPVCRCQRPVALGIPCFHVIVRQVAQQVPISPGQLHVFWRTLDMEAPKNVEVEQCKRKVARNLMDEFFMSDFPNLSADQQHRVAAMVTEIAHPERTTLQEPMGVVHKGRPKYSPNKRLLSDFERADKILEQTPPKRPRGRPSKHPKTPGPASTPSPNSTPVATKSTPQGDFLYMYGIPQCMQDHFTGYFDVDDDGNCGFRAIAHSLGRGEGDWGNVRIHMRQTLDRHEAALARCFLWYTPDQMRVRLGWFEKGIAPRDRWFVLPDMGFLVAQTFNRPFVCVGTAISATFLPLVATDVPRFNETPICIQLISEREHFISVLPYTLSIRLNLIGIVY